MFSKSSGNKESVLSSLTVHKISSLVALLGALLLSTEIYLISQGKNLCQTQACNVVSSYISVSESTLIAIGACFFWLLFIALFFSCRYPNHLRDFPKLVLYPALAFDGALLGFQFFTIQEKCTICIGVALFLIVTGVVYSLSQKNVAGALGMMLIWIGSFSANYIFEMPEPSGAYNEMALFQFQDNPVSVENTSEYTLVISLDCPHCINVVSYLAEYNTANQIWRIASIDQNNESLQRLGKFLDKLPQADNPFALLKKIKLEKEITNSFSINNLVKKNKKTLSFLSNLSVNAIPVLVVKNSQQTVKLFSGSDRVIEYLKTVQQKE